MDLNSKAVVFISLVEIVDDSNKVLWVEFLAT
jgi:hypothetical protein